MGEQQEDPAAAADLQAVEDDLFAEQLHDAIEEALAKLSDHEAAVIRRRYYQRQTWAEIEEDSGIKTSQGRTTEHSALTKLRRNPVLNRFHEEVITYHSYTGSGFAAWKHGGSVEECLIEYLDAKGAYLYGGAVNAAVQQKRKHPKTYVSRCFSLSRRDKKDTLSQNSSDFLFALLGQSWRPLQHPFQIVGARYFPYGKRMLFVSPIKQQSI